MCLDAATTGGNNTGNDTGDDTGAVCPVCGEPVRPVPPTTPRPAEEPMAVWSHLDGEPLCPVMGLNGYRPAHPQFTHTPLPANG